MCRSIHTLRQPEGLPSETDVRAAALQYVRKVSGFRAPSKRNEEAFLAAVDEITAASQRLIESVSHPAQRSAA
jgi:hypothetical protein